MRKYSPFVAGGLVVLVALVSGVKACKSYQTMSQHVEEDRRALHSLQADLSRISTQLADIKARMARMPERPVQMSNLSPPPLNWENQSSRGPKPDMRPPMDSETGSNFPPPPPPPPAANIGSEKVAAYRTELIDRNAQQHQADRAIYGDRVGELYQAARAAPMSGGTGSGSGSSSQGGNSALQTLISEYPQANATGMALSERALQAARVANTVDAEQYYNTLASNENFANIVTDQGVEAVPALQAYLAYQYLQQNRLDEANTLLQTLEKNYASSMVAIPSRQGGGVNYRSVTETVNNLRSRMGGGASAQK